MIDRNGFKNKIVFAIISLLTDSVIAASFSPSGLDGSYYQHAYNISPDGSFFTGSSGSPNIYNPETGFTRLDGIYKGYTSGRAYAASLDNQIIVGEIAVPLGDEAFRWTAQMGMEGLGDLDGGSYFSTARDISADGTIIVGYSISTSGYEAFRWTETEGMVGIGGRSATGISADGSTIVGVLNSESGTEASVWKEDAEMVSLGTFTEGVLETSAAADVSADGEWVVGNSGSAGNRYHAFRWSEATGMQALSIGAGSYPDLYSWGRSVSADGSVIVGAMTWRGAGGNRAMIWTEETGMLQLQDYIEDILGRPLTGWTLQYANGISDDGLTITGEGNNPEGENAHAWIINIDPAFPLNSTFRGSLIKHSILH